MKLNLSAYSAGTRIGIGITADAVPGCAIASRAVSIHSTINGSDASWNSGRVGNTTSSGMMNAPADAKRDRYCA